MTTPNLFEEVSEPNIFNRMLANLRRLRPSWTPRATDPNYINLQAAAARERVLRLFFNERARGAFGATATGEDLDALANTFGVTRLANESDAALEARRLAAVQAFGFAGTPAAYRLHAINAVPEQVLDAAHFYNNAIPQSTVRIVAAGAGVNASAVPPLYGAPISTLGPLVEAYLRDERRAGVGDDNLQVADANLTEYRIAVTLSPSTDETRAAAREICYQYVRDHARFNTTLTPFNLAARLQAGIDGLNYANITGFNIAPYGTLPSGGTLPAGATTVYSCQLNATGVTIA